MYSINYWSVNLSIGLGTILGGMLFKSYRFELFIMLTISAVITLILGMIGLFLFYIVLAGVNVEERKREVLVR